jgi:hypothetical protein
MNNTRPHLAIALDPIKNAFVQAKNRGVRLWYLTEITSENISYCRVPIHRQRAKTFRWNKRELYDK